MISPNAEVRSVSVKDGICYVNFNEEFLNTDYKVDPYVTIYALVNSIVENCATGQVQILVNGETKVTYQSSVDLSQPLRQTMIMWRKRLRNRPLCSVCLMVFLIFFHRNDGRRQSVLSELMPPEIKNRQEKKFQITGQVYQIEVRESLSNSVSYFIKKTARILVYDDAKQSVQIGNKVNVKGELSLLRKRGIRGISIRNFIMKNRR